VGKILVNIMLAYLKVEHVMDTKDIPSCKRLTVHLLSIIFCFRLVC